MIKAVTQRDINLVLGPNWEYRILTLIIMILSVKLPKISENLAKRHELIPIKIEYNELVVAMSDPLNIFAIDDVRIFSGMNVQPVIASSEQIRHAIDVYYGSQEAMKAAEEYKKEYGITEEDLEKEEDIEAVVHSAPIVKLVNSIIEQAVRTEVIYI